MTTLEQCYLEAGVQDPPAWSRNVTLVHPYTGEPIQPRDYQITGLHDTLASPNHRFGLYDTMGAGKSLVAYMYSALFAGMGNKAVTIMPPKLIPQYKQNFYATLKGVPLWMDVFYGTPAQRKKLLAQWKHDCPSIILTTPIMFQKHLEFFCATCDVLIGDEAKWLANPETEMRRAVDTFMGGAGYKAALVMNGTPARSDLVNLFGYIDFTSPGAYADLAQFKRRHVLYSSFNVDFTNKKGRTTTRRVYKVRGYKNVPEIYQRLYEHGRRVECPPPTETRVEFKEIALSDKHHALYTELVENRLIIFEDDSIIDLTQAGQARHACMKAVFDPSFLQLDEEGTVLETVREMLDEVDWDKTKVLLCAYYQSTVEKLVETFQDLGAVALYGKVGGRKADEAKRRFLEDEDCKVLVINYESGGVGLDGLQNVCNLAIAVEPTSIPGDFEQTLGRLARPGQKQGVTMWCLIATGTVYRRMVLDRVKRKNLIDQVVKVHGRMSKAELRAELMGEGD